MNKKLPTQQTARSGFTLLELMVAIVIIATLMALILPAITGALRAADETAVAAEMTQMDQALVTFKQEFGRYPPSNINLYGSQAGWDSDPAAKSTIRSMWRDFNFATGGRLASGTPQNSDPSLATYHPWGDAKVHLAGDECLVFFLGGVQIPNADAPPTLTGFASNSRSPFAVAGQNRTGPFFEFKTDRMEVASDDGDATTLDDANYVYTDGLGSSTGIYYSAAENGRYDPADAAYFQGDGRTPYNKETYQIISPGEDGEFGDIASGQRKVWTEDTDLGNARIQERDNVTNFSGGRLQK